MSEPVRILIVHSDPKISTSVKEMLADEGHQVRACRGSDCGMRSLEEALYHFVLLDATLPPEDQLDLMEYITECCPSTLVIHVSWHAMLKSAVEALHAEAPETDGRGAVSLEAMKRTINRLSQNIKGQNREKEDRRKALIMAKDLQEANLRLLELDRKKDSCLAVATHELRTPITILKGYIRLLRGESVGKLNKRQKHLLDESNRNCDRLLGLVNSMLDRSRLESEIVDIHFQRRPYTETVKQVVSQMQHHIDENGLTVKTEFPGEEILVPYDKNAIEQALINLISNAVKFTPAPGEITIRCEQKNGAVVTEVIDTGVGIEPDEIPKVFDEFNRVGKHHGRRKGAGLGLSICKKIIRAHKGDIWVESHVNGGSRFSFSLPQDAKAPACPRH